MKKLLSPEERRLLLKQHKSERDKRIADRIKVVLLSDDGWAPRRIADALFIDEYSVKNHLETYTSQNRLHPNHKGSQPVLSEQETQALSTHLTTKIYTKIKDIQAYVQQVFGKELGISTLYNWLIKNGFSYKKPKLFPKADPIKQEAFKRTYHKLMNDAAIEGDVVLFGDSVHPSQQVRASYGWIQRGQSACIKTTAARKRVNIMGVLNLETMDFIYQDFEKINGTTTVEFLKKLEQAYADTRRIHVILDQAGYHTCQEVRDFLTTSRVQVHYLPPRSPNLNPIERLWKVMHEHVSNNKFYENFKDFKQNLFEFFDITLQRIRATLITRITDDFQSIY